MKGNGRAFLIVIEFQAELLGFFDVQEWNGFVADLLSRGLTPPAWAAGEKPDPIGVMIDFHGLRRPHHDLDHIDLRMCWLADADFTGASLRHARMSCVCGASCRGARLDHADFREVEISGCIFSGATGLDSAMFDGAVYDPANPPIGLPPEILAVCKPEAEPPHRNRREPCSPQEPTVFQEAPLRCIASIHIVPMGE